MKKRGGDEGHQRVDEALSQWRQGDCAVGEQWFAYRVLPSDPLTEDVGRYGAGRTDNCDKRMFCAPVGECADLERSRRRLGRRRGSCGFRHPGDPRV